MLSELREAGIHVVDGGDRDHDVQRIERMPAVIGMAALLEISRCRRATGMPSQVGRPYNMVMVERRCQLRDEQQCKQQIARGKDNLAIPH